MDGDNKPPVKIPEGVYEAFEFIRTEGVTNMFDRAAVQRYAHQYDYHEAVVWLDDPENEDAYAEGMFRGFEPEESTTAASA